MLIKSHCQIAGIGAYFPSQIVTSQELMREIKSEENYAVSENWLSEVCGIDERRVANAEETPSVLAIKAAEIALRDSGVSPREIDAVIFCGVSRDWIEPSIAHRVQQELGCTKAICFDVSNACHGFMNGILIADNLMQSSDATHVLVVTGEDLTDMAFHYVNQLKKKEASFEKVIGTLTLGDAGAAMILTPKTGIRGFQHYNFHTEGQYAELCWFGTNMQGYEGQMIMGKISSVMLKLHASLIKKTYQALNWQAEEIKHLICHQAGAKPHKKFIEIANVSQRIAPISYRKFGNITTATIPVNLYNTQPQQGDKILIAGAGSGASVSQSGLIF